MILSAAAVIACAPFPEAGTTPEADYRRFLAAWAGEYHNLAQTKAQNAAGRPEEGRNRPTRLFIRRVDLPAFGADAYYAEWQDATDPSRVTRQRIYAFEIDSARQKLRLKLHIWPMDEAFRSRTAGAHLEPAKLANVTPADMAGLTGCDVFFEATDSGFAGSMQRGACAFPAPDGTPIYSWSQMTLSSRQFSYLDGWFRTNGEPYMRFTDDWYVFDKVR